MEQAADDDNYEADDGDEHNFDEMIMLNKYCFKVVLGLSGVKREVVFIFNAIFLLKPKPLNHLTIIHRHNRPYDTIP